MKIILELYDQRYSVEYPHDDVGGQELKDLFARMLVVAGFSPSIMGDEDGTYVYVGNDEVVIKEEKLNEPD